jgi:hypothetical protein
VNQRKKKKREEGEIERFWMMMMRRRIAMTTNLIHIHHLMPFLLPLLLQQLHYLTWVK